MAKKKEKVKPDRVLLPGKPDYEQVDNKVVTARYTLITFFPVAIVQQFRRFANLYFLIVGIIMAIGYYSNLFESAFTPWTTLGPLCLVIVFSLLVEGSSDYTRHLSDQVTNNTDCVVLRRSDELEEDETATRDEKVLNGKDIVVNINKAYYETTSGTTKSHKAPKNSAMSEDAVNVAVGFEQVRRMDIRQGHFVLVKNREMAPADMLLLASSNDQGSAYIETSSIDGETNLKLRTSPRLPADVMKKLRAGQEARMAESTMESISEEAPTPNFDAGASFETIEEAVKRITRFSYLGRPEGESALDHPTYDNVDAAGNSSRRPNKSRVARASTAFAKSVRNFTHEGTERIRRASEAVPKYAPRNIPAVDDGRYISALTTEPPNPSVHTFQGKLTLPPFDMGGNVQDIPLGADNVILRGAVVRNTEWVIGVAFFTGTDTKLVQNSFDTPSKFSQLDILMNYTVAAILTLMIITCAALAGAAYTVTEDNFDELWYVGFNDNSTEKWPYLPQLEAPDWDDKTKWVQYFFLYITLLNQFIPLSLYITVEIVTFIMLWFVYVDLDMYDDTTNTAAAARSTTVTDLGRIQYIFSDKTGTLTQNVMTFRRCSVDGIAFGSPIEKSRPGEEAEEEAEKTPFLPLRHLLVGQFESAPSKQGGLENIGGSSEGLELQTSEKMTFNAEMFLRIMCLCHTVVVEKDLDKKDYISSGSSVSSGVTTDSSKKRRLFRRNKKSKNSETDDTESKGDSASQTPEGAKEMSRSEHSMASSGDGMPMKSEDGAPPGYAYQAESPDEGALVSAASLTYGFQVVGRDSNGITVRISKPSHFQDSSTVEGLKSGNLTMKKLAADTASEKSVDEPEKDKYPDPALNGEQREESWSILAVNKFDSTRKRMSILLRSPEELGSIPVLFCKGADSAMLDPEVCSSSRLLPGNSDQNGKSESGREVSALSTVSEDLDAANADTDEDEWEIAQMLGIQAHLGDFASEGLRTLVLGLRVLTDSQCDEWMAQYNAAANSMVDREKLLTEAALAIEKNLHIAGATAIEDKLQVGVPKTIATLGQAGIKLWVLTGDKRETAVEIGYSTAVLTPKMSVMEVGDLGKHYVRTQMSMEFIRLVKKGKLPEYQTAILDPNARKSLKQRKATMKFFCGKCLRACGRWFTRCWAAVLYLFCRRKKASRKMELVQERKEREKEKMPDDERRRKVRERADLMIKLWLESDESKGYRRPKPNSSPVKDELEDAGNSEDVEFPLVNDETPKVFNRAASARVLLSDMKMSGKMSQSDLRRISLAHKTAQEVSARDEDAIVDEDALSLESYFPGHDKEDLAGNFDKRKRTMLERTFAVDRNVRKGQLKKHVKSEKLAEHEEGKTKAKSRRSSFFNPQMSDGPRALVIEGAALKHLLGDKELEEILFACASVCDSVIACRVSPKQKAELVNLVRHNVKPTPITLAIGDGANDVGMIQEAHVGVGISGKEGTQAVNASDFAISQFRFLETLILIHGRWDFFRLSTVVLYSFYKNAVQAGIMIVFNFTAVFSGQPYFNQWLVASLNFVCGAPIIFTGIFDRNLSKDYVRKNPEVYRAARENEMITTRTLLRWFFIAIAHICILYFFTAPASSYGGGMTSAFEGLMDNEDDSIPGNGEGGDWLSVGTVTFTCMVILMAYKVLYESRSLVHGRWPAITCSKANDNFLNRLAYTWIGITWLSIGFYLIFICVYQLVGRLGANSLSQFVDMANHVLATRSINWMLIAFVPIWAIAFDVIFKTFSNMYYPTQTQIHMEIEAHGKRDRKRAQRAAARAARHAENGADA